MVFVGAIALTRLLNTDSFKERYTMSLSREEAANVAQVLSEALPYIQRFTSNSAAMRWWRMI
jgi:K+/H+ antiporter YhaU regulatory subunit KhtT